MKDILKKTAGKAAGAIAKASTLAPDQLNAIKERQADYLKYKPDPADAASEKYTRRLLDASAITIYKSYLTELSRIYKPVKLDDTAAPHIGYLDITMWVSDKGENSIEKLANAYEVLANKHCNVSLVFHRRKEGTKVYLAVTDLGEGSSNKSQVIEYLKALKGAIKGNFPGSEYSMNYGILPCFEDGSGYSIATISNLPSMKSEKFISQTIEKLLDGIQPEKLSEEYILILMATPVLDIEQRKSSLSQLYSSLVPYASWNQTFTYDEHNAFGSSATVGINIGASAGIQNGQNQSVTKEQGEEQSSGTTDTKSTNTMETNSSERSHTDGEAKGKNAFVHAEGGIGPVSAGSGVGTSSEKSSSDTTATGHSTSSSVGEALSHTLGNAVSNSIARTIGRYSGTNFGANIGASFARTSTVTATIGKNEGITQTFMNHGIKHALELLEKQMSRLEQCTALGMWDFAAYVLSPDSTIANNVAYSYLAITQGEESYLSQSAINKWRGDQGDDNETSQRAKAIYKYLRILSHPLFGLNDEIESENPDILSYPAEVTATVSISGKELAYSMNFPSRSVAGLPVIRCAEFGRDVSTYESIKEKRKIDLGNIFHMNHEEQQAVSLVLDSLASHVFITGSTGSGKTNTVCCILEEAIDQDIRFMVIEPAKGEYKNFFSNEASVYGTNPLKTPLLRINPFSFSDDIHVLEHLDRLVEIFNACWPMYAAMPAVLKSAIENAYTDCGWDLIHSENKYGEKLYPSFAMVAENVRTIIDTSEYDAENKGAYKGSLLTRLQSLSTGINGLVFSGDELPDAELFDKNVIVDLSRVGSLETKSLIMGMLVLKLQEYRISNVSSMNSKLRHITVMEEAHNLLKRTSTEFTSEDSNLAGKSVEMISNAIAEMRTFGEGFIIADQAPGLLDMSVIRNTNTKIIMRLPDLEDRELVGKSAILNDDQIEELAKLPCGVAAVYQNEWIQPVLCKVQRFSGEEVVYGNHPAADVLKGYDESRLKAALFDCIIRKEIAQKENRKYIRKYKDSVIKSRLDVRIKISYLKYIMASENSNEALSEFIFNLLDAGEAFEAARDISNEIEWKQKVISMMIPDSVSYPPKYLDIVLAMTLAEQARINSEYTDIYHRFIEVLESREGIS